MATKSIIKRLRQYGFTMVELVIVIVVIGTLSAIGVATYNGVNSRTLNANRVSEFRNWVKLFKIYKSTYGNYPDVPKGTATDPITYCLGTGFPNGSDNQPRCRDYTWACDHAANAACTSFPVSNAAPLMAEFAKLGNISSTDKIPVNGTVGPYAEYYQWNISIQGWFSGSSASDCPSGTTYSWTDGNGRVACYISFDYTD